MAIERERELRVENARQTTRAFRDNVAFRKKLRGMFSLLSGGVFLPLLRGVYKAPPGRERVQP